MQKKKIFIVHGRDKLPALELARFIEKKYRIDTILLEEEAHKGRTLIKKLEDSMRVDFAFIILTPDDIGALKGDPLTERARQNVIFELGQFMGRIGRKNTCLLIKGNIEIPSDLGGVGYYRFNESIKELFWDIANELKEAKLISIPKRTVRGRGEYARPKRDLYFDLGLERRTRGILWKNFDVVEIQGIVYQYFISLGYKVDWAHAANRSRRKKIGFDLLCEKDGKRIGVIISKTPGPKDRERIEKLAEKNYEEKMYLYVTLPSLSFMEQIGSYSENVKMISMNEFEQKMQDTEVGSQILCHIYYSNSKFIKLANDFLFELLNLTKNSTNEDSYKKLDKPLPELWQLKDHSVMMKKSIETLLTLLDEPMFYAKIGTKNLLHIFKQALGTLEYNMYGFYQTWAKLLNKDKNLVRQTYRKYGNRSNWLGLLTFGHYIARFMLYSPGILLNNLKSLSAIDKDLHEKEEAKFAALLKKEAGRIYVPTPLFANFVREDFLRPHFGFALSLEGLVDQMFEL